MMGCDICGREQCTADWCSEIGPRGAPYTAVETVTVSGPVSDEQVGAIIGHTTVGELLDAQAKAKAVEPPPAPPADEPKRIQFREFL